MNALLQIALSGPALAAPDGSATSRSAWSGAAVAALAVLAASLGRMALDPMLEDRAPGLLYLLAVMVSALYGGRFAGLLATVFGALASWLLFIEPRASYSMVRASDGFLLLLFGLAGILVSWVVGAVRGFTAESRRWERDLAAAHARGETLERENDARFQIMADHAPVLIWMSDAEKARTWFNKPWLEFTGRTLAQERGSEWTGGVHPDDLRRCLETYRDSFDARAPFAVEYRLRDRNGEYRWLLDNGVPLYGRGGEFDGYIGSCVDITGIKENDEARKRMLSEERELRASAELANRMKDEFLSSLSHELRTPLNAILGWAQIVRRKNSSPEQIASGLDIIERNARNQARIIDDLLDMNRILSGKTRLDLREVELGGLLADVVEIVRPTAESKEIRLDARIDPGLGVIRCDGQRVQQIVWNLTSNAVKFTPKGGSVEVRADRLGEEVVIRVSDDGAGIMEEFLPFVFDRFRQPDTSKKRRHGGLGLGLAIVRHLVEMHGGRVKAESAGEGAGTTFTVRLPLSAQDSKWATGSDQPETAALAPLPADALAGLRVLVVDDQGDVRDLARRMLEESGAAVMTVGSAALGVSALKEFRPDVLVSDIGMPEMDGYEFLEKVRELPAEEGGQVPAAALTAFTRPEDRQMALKSGFQLHLAKPIEPGELVQAVLSLSRMREKVA